ncbi:hypothetical protein [Thermomonas sp.]|uniref:hypothetical protein n=1 Tax=Thermomonas sp. TaxID=1971895 RepID=UPI002489D019|nr:hypothetical protein [Thermomonas sp.]MDI1253319.1 hypothetical protein [Thermomonas sp.]
MARESREPDDAALQRQRSLARWDNEGGAMASGSQVEPELADQAISMPAVTDFEFMVLHSRVIALENLVTSLLATATKQQLELARDMAAFITPRAGFTQHPLTIRAAEHMVNLVERAELLRSCKTF